MWLWALGALSAYLPSLLFLFTGLQSIKGPTAGLSGLLPHPSPTRAMHLPQAAPFFVTSCTSLFYIHVLSRATACFPFTSSLHSAHHLDLHLFCPEDTVPSCQKPCPLECVSHSRFAQAPVEWRLDRLHSLALSLMQPEPRPSERLKRELYHSMVGSRRNSAYEMQLQEVLCLMIKLLRDAFMLLNFYL